MAYAAQDPNPYATPASHAPVEERVAFLRRVGMLTFGGLTIASVAAVVSAGAIIAVPALSSGWIPMIIMLGAIFASRFVGSSLVMSPVPTTQYAGFVLGSGLQGVAMGYLILSAVLLSAELYGNPLMMIGQAMGLVGLTMLGMVAYLLTGPKNLSYIGGMLSMLSMPMLALMVMSFVIPIGGPFGILLNVLFIAISAGGLLYNLNSVLHTMDTRMHVPAAYHVTLGVLVLFWNVLTLLMRLQRR